LKSKKQKPHHGRQCVYARLPTTDYIEALKLQRDIVTARIEEKIDVDVVLILEHFPVFTLGRRGCRDNLMVHEQFLKESNIEILHVERGGDITFHGPGQLVVYPIIGLSARV
jgi:lipoate-protein ligase B